jgi:hypothetical protein
MLIMIQESLFSRTSRGAVTLVLAAALSPIFAEAASASAPAVSPEATYQSERADCVAGRTQQAQKTCLVEAASARDAARKGLLTTETPQVLHTNRQQRCLAQPEGPERAACDRMAQGAGTVTGSVAEGGELRELTTVVPPEKKPMRIERAASSVQ